MQNEHVMDMLRRAIVIVVLSAEIQSHYTRCHQECDLLYRSGHIGHARVSIARSFKVTFFIMLHGYRTLRRQSNKKRKYLIHTVGLTICK